MALHLCGAVKASFLAVMGKRLFISSVFSRNTKKPYPIPVGMKIWFFFVLNPALGQMTFINYASTNPLAFKTVAISC